MKKYFLIICVLTTALWISCASRKVDPVVGSWSYTVSGTPEGNVEGTMIIAKEGESYIGKLQGESGSMDLRDVEISENEMKSKFSYQGYVLNLEGTFEGEQFDGKVVYDAYTTFPIKATKLTQ